MCITKYLWKFAPDYIIVDDCLREKNDLHSLDELDSFIKKVETLQTIPVYHFTTMKEIFGTKAEEFELYMNQLKDNYSLILKALVEEILTCKEQYMANYVSIIPPEEIEEYYRCRIFLGKLKTIAVPALFPLFNYIAENPNAKLKIIDAKFKKELMDLWSRRYKLETGVNIIFVPEPLPEEYNLEDQHSIVYRVKGRTWFSPGALENEPKLRVKIQVHSTMFTETNFNYLASADVGLITSLRFASHDFLPDKFYQLDSLHYGDLRGKNDLALVKLGFVVGTYLSSHWDKVTHEGGIVEDFRRMFCVDPPTEYENDKAHGGHYKFKFKPLDAWRWLHEDYEMYQAIHRFRPLRHKCDILLYGLCPIEIEEDGVKVIDMPFRVGGVRLDKRKELVIEMLKDRSMTQDEIVEELTKDHISFRTAYDESLRLKKQYRKIFFVEDGTKIWSLRYQNFSEINHGTFRKLPIIYYNYT